MEAKGQTVRELYRENLVADMARQSSPVVAACHAWLIDQLDEGVVVVVPAWALPGFGGGHESYALEVDGRATPVERVEPVEGLARGTLRWRRPDGSIVE